MRSATSYSKKKRKKALKNEVFSSLIRLVGCSCSNYDLVLAVTASKNIDSGRKMGAVHTSQLLCTSRWI